MVKSLAGIKNLEIIFRSTYNGKNLRSITSHFFCYVFLSLLFFMFTSASVSCAFHPYLFSKDVVLKTFCVMSYQLIRQNDSPIIIGNYLVYWHAKKIDFFKYMFLGCRIWIWNQLPPSNRENPKKNCYTYGLRQWGKHGKPVFFGFTERNRKYKTSVSRHLSRCIYMTTF